MLCPRPPFKQYINLRLRDIKQNILLKKQKINFSIFQHFSAFFSKKQQINFVFKKKF
jgi:hypothetical protein